MSYSLTFSSCVLCDYWQPNDLARIQNFFKFTENTKNIEEFVTEWYSKYYRKKYLRKYGLEFADLIGSFYYIVRVQHLVKALIHKRCYFTLNSSWKFIRYYTNDAFHRNILYCLAFVNIIQINVFYRILWVFLQNLYYSKKSERFILIVIEKRC